MNITYLLKYLWEKKWLILAPTILAAIIAWFFTRNEKRSFTSEAEISTGYMEVNPLEDSRRVNNTVLFNNVMQTLQSRQVLDPVSYDLLLHDLQGAQAFREGVRGDDANRIISQYPGGKEGLIRSLNNKADSFYVLDLARNEDRMIRQLGDLCGYSGDALMNLITVRRIEGSDFIKITAATPNPKLSAFIANAICGKFLTFYQSRQGQASASSLDTLKGIMEEKKQILDNKLKLLPDEGDYTVSSSIGMLGGLQAQLSQQKTNLIAAQVALDNVNQQIGASGDQGGASNNEDIINLRTNIDALWSKYVNGGSSDAALLDQINKLRGQLQQKMSAVGHSTAGIPVADLLRRKMDLEVRVSVANQTMKDLESKIAALNGTVQSSASKQNLVQSIQSEIEAARQDYMNANRLYNAALNRNIFPGNDFKQTLIASPSLYPDPSKKMKVIGFAGVGVFFFVVFLLLFFEFIDPAIKTPTFLKEQVSLPLLAHLKYIDIKKTPIEQLFNTEEEVSKSWQGFREQVKQLRYEVEHSGKKMILVTGYQAGSGRTTLLECLAAGLCLTNRKVLLVDANFRNNTLTKKYQAGPDLETFEARGDQPAVNKAIAAIAVTTKNENIKVVGCGGGDYTPREILSQKNIFDGLKEDKEFDYVLIDCASLSQGPDAKELLRYADAVIISFAADQPLTEEGKKFIDFLKGSRVSVLGTVLNRVPVYSTDL